MTGAAAALVAALLAWAFAPRPVEVEVAAVTRGHFETTIDEDAKTRIRDRYVVSAPLAGRLQRITLREGDRVKAGDVVARLTPALSPMLDARTLREQQLRVDIAQAQVQAGAARVDGARVALLQAKNEVARSQELAREGFVSSTKLESDRLTALAAQKDLDAATENRHAADHEVEQARAALMAVQRTDVGAAHAFEVRAPVAARVLRLSQASETVVPLGTPLIELGDVDDLEVVAELLTSDALRARPGSRVLIERWGGDAPLSGRVRLVEPSAFTKISALGVEEQRVKVLIDITSPPEQWRALGDGFRVGVRVVTLELDDAVQVPVSAVFPLPEAQDAPETADSRTAGHMAVFVVDGGRARLVPVVVGARNGAQAWLRQGLSAGASVIIYPAAQIRDGVRVKARKV